jgi:hypothetical protein
MDATQVKKVSLNGENYVGVLSEDETSFVGIKGGSLKTLLLAELLDEQVHITVNPNVAVVTTKLDAKEKIELGTMLAQLELTKKTAPSRLVADLFQKGL